MGNGRSINIWRDNWLPRDMGLKVSGRRRPCCLRRVDQLLLDGGRAWNSSLLQRCFWAHDVEAILQIKIAGPEYEDVLAWQRERTGCFSVRLEQAKQGLQASSAHPLVARPLWRKIWQLQVPNKVRIFAWKVAHGALPTKLNKWRRRLEHTNECVICGLEAESEYHALIQ